MGAIELAGTESVLACASSDCLGNSDSVIGRSLLSGGCVSSTAPVATLVAVLRGLLLLVVSFSAGSVACAGAGGLSEPVDASLEINMFYIQSI